MKNLENEFNKTYEEIKLNSNSENLRELKEKNIIRLKKSLKDSNLNYRFDVVEQGSIAMDTGVKSKWEDMDIDVAIIFNEEDLKENSEEAKKEIFESFKSTKENFKRPPENRKNALTIWYSENKHVDFAIYKVIKTTRKEMFKHAGKEWTERDPRGITDWFIRENDKKNNKLRIVVRMLKYWCKLNLNEDLPGGLLLTILVNECFYSSDSNYLSFFKTLINIKNRLKIDLKIENPVNNLDITKDEKTINKLLNLKKLLINKEKTINEITINENLDLFKVFFELENKPENKKNEDFIINVSISSNNVGSDIICDNVRTLGKGFHLTINIVNVKNNNFNFKDYKIEYECFNSGVQAKNAEQSYWKKTSESNKNIMTSSRFKGVHILKAKIFFKKTIIKTIKTKVIVV
jgi:predicted nucleotidyltransferase